MKTNGSIFITESIFFYLTVTIKDTSRFVVKSGIRWRQTTGPFWRKWKEQYFLTPYLWPCFQEKEHLIMKRGRGSPQDLSEDLLEGGRPPKRHSTSDTKPPWHTDTHTHTPHFTVGCWPWGVSAYVSTNSLAILDLFRAPISLQFGERCWSC